MYKDLSVDSYLYVLLTAACLEKFPGTPTSVLGSAINGNLTELRLKRKRVVADSDIDAVSESLA